MTLARREYEANIPTLGIHRAMNSAISNDSAHTVNPGNEILVYREKQVGKDRILFYIEMESYRLSWMERDANIFSTQQCLNNTVDQIPPLPTYPILLMTISQPFKLI